MKLKNIILPIVAVLMVSSCDFLDMKLKLIFTVFIRSYPSNTLFGEMLLG